MNNNQEEHPIVFISYSHDDEEHITWTTKLAEKLRHHGVDVIFDQWDLHIGADIRFFMEQGLTKSRKVICVCSEKYVKKFNVGKGGVGYESSIITQDLLRNINCDYILPIVRNNSAASPLPVALGTKFYVDFTDDEKFWDNYRRLLEAIYEKTHDKMPKLGPNPFASSPLVEQINSNLKLNSVKFISSSMFGKVSFCFADNNGEFILGTGAYLFKTHWSQAGNNSIHAYGKIGYKVDVTDFPKYDEISSFDFSSSCRTIKTGEIVIFMNQNGNFAAIKIGKVESSGHGYKVDLMNFEYKIYDIEHKIGC